MLKKENKMSIEYKRISVGMGPDTKKLLLNLRAKMEKAKGDSVSISEVVNAGLIALAEKENVKIK